MKATVCDMCGKVIEDEKRWKMNVHELFITRCFAEEETRYECDVCGNCMNAFVKSMKGDGKNG